MKVKCPKCGIEGECYFERRWVGKLGWYQLMKEISKTYNPDEPGDADTQDWLDEINEFLQYVNEEELIKLINVR